MQYVDQVKIVIIEFWIIAFYIIQKFHALIFKVLSRTFIFENIHCLRHLILFFPCHFEAKIGTFFPSLYDSLIRSSHDLSQGGASQCFTSQTFHVSSSIILQPWNVSFNFQRIVRHTHTHTHTQSIFRFTNSQHFSSSQIIVVNLLAAISTIICSQNSFHIKSCHHYRYIIFPINVQNSIFFMLFSLFQLICTCFTIVCLYILLQDVL